MPKSEVPVMNIEIRRQIGKLVRVARANSKMTQQEVADQAGVTSGYISLIESERVEPSLETMGKIMAAMGYRLTIDFESATP